jgi:glucokinase
LRGKSFSNIDVVDIGKMANEGDALSIDVFCDTAIILSETIKPVLKENDIQCLLFGGQISRSFKYMENSIKNSLKDIGCLKKISVVSNMDTAALLGAMRTLKEEMLMKSIIKP